MPVERPLAIQTPPHLEHRVRVPDGRTIAFAEGGAPDGMPLIAFHFEQLNPWAVIASLLLAPVVVVALIAGFLKIILTAIIPGGAGIWATIAAAPIALMRHGVDWLAHIPGSDVPFPSKSISLILVYYALLALCLLPIVAPKLTVWNLCRPSIPIW